MYFNLNWHITIGRYRLAMLDSVEIHKSVDLLSDTCTITIPGSVYNKALKIEDEEGKYRIKRGDIVVVQLGYDDNLREEFRGYVLSISTDDGNITINCEDDLFLMRKAVKDREFVKTTVKTIAQYLVGQTGSELKVNCSLTIDYDKFVIHQATAYDVLKKIKEETGGSIYLAAGELHIHPPMMQKGGDVTYSFQVNIEQSDLKYKRQEDKQLQVVVEAVGADGQKKTVSFGTTGGDQVTKKGDGMSDASMKLLAETEYKRLMYDGYEGSVTGWLIPFCKPTDTARIIDEDYEFKQGKYYVTAVTTNVSSGGGSRQVQLGRRLL